ncbi:MAG: hypothetical protein EXS30_09780 [Pedosphaera sp.]|nr:hypothetical protein [Pedosphaera sp.]
MQTALDGAGPEAATQIGRYKKQKRLATIHGIELEIADDALDSISEEAVTLDISPSRQIEGGLNLSSTHQTTDERIQRLEAKWEKMDRRFGFHEFQQRN